MGARIGARLVEADASNAPVHVRAEFHPQLHRAVGPPVHQAGDRRAGPERDNIDNDDAQGLGDRLPIRSRHPCGEAERAGRRGRSGDDPCAAGER